MGPYFDLATNLEVLRFIGLMTLLSLRSADFMRYCRDLKKFTPLSI